MAGMAGKIDPMMPRTNVTPAATSRKTRRQPVAGAGSGDSLAAAFTEEESDMLVASGWVTCDNQF